MYGPGLYPHPDRVSAHFQAQRIPFTATPEVLQAIESIGRTEDLVFCPRNRRLAIAAFLDSRLLVLDVHIPDGAPDGAIELRDFVWIESPSLQHPHGLNWLDERTLVVANRQGQLSRIELPEASPARHLRFDADGCIAGPQQLLSAPGSVAARTLRPGLAELYVCNNDAHHVTQHLYREGEGMVSSSRLVAWGLSIPDGVALSADGRWLAVSNHNEQRVLVYENQAGLGPQSAPCASLVGCSYPHGLRFTPDGRHLLVADAGEPLVHVYARPDSQWHGTLRPVRQASVMTQEVFLRGRDNPQEGGPKGLDIDRTGRILALSSQEDPLAFFALAPMLEEAAGARDSQLAEAPAHALPLAESLERHLSGLAREHAILQAHVGDAQARNQELTDRLAQCERSLGEASAALSAQQAQAGRALSDRDADLQALRHHWQAEVGALRASRSWRITAPLRMLGRWLRPAA